MNGTLREAFEFFNRGEKQEAAKLLAALVIQQPNNASAWFGLALCLNDKDKKIYCFQKVLSIDPNNTKAKEMLEKLSPRTDTKECPYCEESIPEGAKWCRNCGRDLRDKSTVEPEPSEVSVQEPQDEERKETKECPYCSESNPEGANWCRNCGRDLRDNSTVEPESSAVSVQGPRHEEPKETKECPHCGEIIHVGANWCRNCGRDFRDYSTVEPGSSEIAIPEQQLEETSIQRPQEYRTVQKKKEGIKITSTTIGGALLIGLIGVLVALFYVFSQMNPVSQVTPKSMVYNPKPTNTSRPPTATPNPSTIVPPYFEDFSDGSGIWHVRNDDEVSFKVSDGKYVINPKNPGGSWWTSPQAKLDNIQLEFTSSFMYTYPKEDGGFRVNFRCQNIDEELCYTMTIAENGYLFVHRDAEIMVEHKLSQHINLYDHPNDWVIVMDDSNFEIHCNGELLTTFSDSKYKSGDFGFGVFNSEDDTWGFNGVAFDNIRVSLLE